jgi:signal transduction histidine kinase
MARILVVEDSPTQAQQMLVTLEEASFDAEAVASAEEGYARLTRGRYDLVLTDLVLPGESGFDLCRRIKADPAYHNLPVVVLTSQGDPINVLRGLEAGADGFMTKDHRPEEIIQRLRRTLAMADGKTTGPEQHARVAFLDCQFEIDCNYERLLNVLLSAFEDVVHVNQQFEASAAALRQANVQLHQAVRSEQEARKELQHAQSRMVQTEKLSALGQMVAGIAHEINNPLAFVGNNLAVLQRDAQALRQVIDAYRQADAVLAAHQPTLAAHVQQLAQEVDLPYVLDNLDGLTSRSSNGLQRIREIVRNLRDFARLDEGERKEANVNEGIRSTVDILRPKAKERQVELVLELGDMPEVTCYPAKVNQVVLNLVANAVDACAVGGRVTVRTTRHGDGVEIHVIDNGPGIDPAIRDRIFDPFFTTKPPGQGTGLGLSISYGIAQDHGGRIAVESTPGRGAHFTFTLPKAPPPAPVNQGHTISQ